MSRLLTLGFLLIALLSSCVRPIENLENRYAVIPLPQAMLPQAGQFLVDENTTWYVEEEVLRSVVQAFMVDWPVCEGQEIKEAGKTEQQQFTFRLTKDLTDATAYRLSITPERVLVEGARPQGVFYGIQTLRQLLAQTPTGENCYLPAVEIEDKARFSYRGMHLDVARHFYPVETVKRLIDQLAYHKMNVFHWHLTDDQGWRIEIKRYPKLTEVGAYRNGTLVGHYNDQPHQFDGKRYGGFYTQDEIREVVQYAEERFVQIIPEIEMPGHAQAALAAYPELACDEGPAEVWQLWGVSEHIYCPTEATFTFLENVLDEVAALFPGKYIHIGGDECPKAKWEQSAFAQKLMREEDLKDEFELQSYFIRRIEKHLNSRGKLIIGWDEILEGGLAPNATIMSWRGIEGGIAAAQAGHDVVMTPSSHCYLDYYQSDHPDEPLAIGGLIPLERIYTYEPIPEELTPEQYRHVLGAQVNVWTEYITNEEKLEYMIFPRLTALAEVVWSPAEQRDFADFLDRLVPHLDRLESMDITPANHLHEIEAEISTQDGVEVTLGTLADLATIYYTSDGREPSPSDQRYTAPIKVTESMILKARAFQDGEEAGRSWKQTINFHAATGGSITLATAPHVKYNSGGEAALINGIKGSNERYGDNEWLGFSGDDLLASIDLGGMKTISKVNFRFFNGEGQWIYLPAQVTIAHSVDGKAYTELGRLGDISGTEKVITPRLEFPAVTTRYLKINVKNYGIIPSGKQGAGNPAWLFVDEIEVE